MSRNIIFLFWNKIKSCIFIILFFCRNPVYKLEGSRVKTHPPIVLDIILDIEIQLPPLRIVFISINTLNLQFICETIFLAFEKV